MRTNRAKPPKPFIVPVFIPHAGCQHRCVFCDQRRTTGQPSGVPDTESLNNTIRTFLEYRRDNSRWSEISFFGGNFLGLREADRHRLLTLAATYVAQRRVNGIRFSTRPDTLDKERLRAIADFPVTTVEVGVQSMCNRVLELNQRGHTAEQAQAALELLQSQTHYQVGAQLMVGLPGDSLPDLMATGRRISEMRPDFVRIYPTLVLGGSRLAQWFAQGRYTPLNLQESLDRTKALYTLFSRSNIRIVRMGLQPTADLNPDAGVIAGPFHPAYGELVLAALWRDAITRHLNQHGAGDGALVIHVHPRNMSQLRGQKNENVTTWKSCGLIRRVEIACDSAVAENLAIVNEVPCHMVP